MSQGSSGSFVVLDLGRYRNILANKKRMQATDPGNIMMPAPGCTQGTIRIRGQNRGGRKEYQERALAARKGEPFSTTTSHAPCLQLSPGETGWGERSEIALDPG